MRILLISLLVLGVGVGAALLLVRSPGVGARTTIDGTLIGSVGSPTDDDAHVIALSETTVAAGTYQLDVTDRSTIHNFHFCNKGVDATHCAAGAAVNQKTTISGTGSSSWTVTLTPGTYIYICDPHSGSMHGTLVVTGEGGTTTTTPTLKLNILAATATRKKVVVKAKAGRFSHVTAILLDKMSMELARAEKDGTTVTMTLKPLAKLKPGKYIVEVNASSTDASAVKRKPVRVY